MDEYLAKKMCELIASTTPYSKEEVKGVYERTKSIDVTISVLNTMLRENVSSDSVLEIVGSEKIEEREYEIKMCSDCRYFKQVPNSHEGICSKGHGIVMQRAGGLPLGYRNYYDEACSEALEKGEDERRENEPNVVSEDGMLYKIRWL